MYKIRNSQTGEVVETCDGSHVRACEAADSLSRPASYVLEDGSIVVLAIPHHVDVSHAEVA